MPCLRKLAESIRSIGLVAMPGATFPDAAALTRQVDLLMVFGGDGTLLRVAREAAGTRTPIVGINAGSLGFLTDVQAHQLPLAIRQILAGETVLESRPLIARQAIFFPDRTPVPADPVQVHVHRRQPHHRRDIVRA